MLAHLGYEEQAAIAHANSQSISPSPRFGPQEKGSKKVALVRRSLVAIKAPCGRAAWWPLQTSVH
jgi:hypothetical protein